MLDECCLGIIGRAGPQGLGDYLLLSSTNRIFNESTYLMFTVNLGSVISSYFKQ